MIKPALGSYNNSLCPSPLMCWASENTGIVVRGAVSLFAFISLFLFFSVAIRLFVVSRRVLFFWYLDKAFSLPVSSLMCYFGRGDTTVTCARRQAYLRSSTLQWWLGSSDWLWIHSALRAFFFCGWLWPKDLFKSMLVFIIQLYTTVRIFAS